MKMIPVNALTAAAAAQNNVNIRRDNVAYERAAATTVVENEGEIHRKKEERAKIVSETKEVQAKQRDEEHLPEDEGQQKRQKRGGLTDIYA